MTDQTTSLRLVNESLRLFQGVNDAIRRRWDAGRYRNVGEALSHLDRLQAAMKRRSQRRLRRALRAEGL